MTDTLAIFHSACQHVCDNRAEKSLNYAVGYALSGLDMHQPEACRVQCIYILNNMHNWRGAVAKECRADFKRLSKKGAWD